MFNLESGSGIIIEFWMSFGTSTTTGPGLPDAAISKAARTVASSFSDSVTRKTCLATEPMTLVIGAS